MDVLVAKNVNKRFGGLQALTSLDITVAEKSIHSVIGPNGAGKTTFFNCITGFYNPGGRRDSLPGRADPGHVARPGGRRAASRAPTRTFASLRT